MLVGWRALTTLPVQQYPQIESTSVVITTVYYGASAETVRGFLTTPIERAVSAISGVDYVESTSRAGVSTVTVRLKLNHNSTAALAEVTARLQQVRSELPPEAEPPVVEVQRADRPYATFYLSFTSTERTVPEITDWLTADAAAAALDPAGRAAGDRRRRPADRHADLDRSRPAGRAQPRPRRRATRRSSATTTWPPWARPRATWCRSTCWRTPTCARSRSSRNLIVADRDGAIVRLSDVARVELGAEEADLVAKYSEKEGVYLGRLAAGRRERDRRGAAAPAGGDGAHPADAAEGHRHAAGVRRHHVHARTRSRDHQDAGRDDPDRRLRGVPVHGLGPDGAGAAGGDAGVAGRGRRS